MAAGAAYGAAALFTLGLARFALPEVGLVDGTNGGLLVALLPHLVLLVGVWPRLLLPRWATGAGLTWLLLDISSDVIARAGAAPDVFLGTRYVGHLFAAAWIVAIALRTGGATRVVGIVLAVLLGAIRSSRPGCHPSRWLQRARYSSSGGS